ncbi:MAG: ABC transporter substrate-binding protein [Desulfobacterales bacterium]|jgi:branched-chain amino acid transport system substrate-binding protein
MSNKQWTCFSVVLASLFLMVCAMSVQAADTHKIASSLAITGPTSDAGNPYSKGMEDYIRYVIDEKLLGDDKVEISIRDDQYKTDVTKRNFEEFLDSGIVLYLNYSTGSTLGLKRDFEEEKIAVIPASFHRGNLEDSNYIFLPIASYSAQVIGLAEYVANNHKDGKAKVALFIHPSAFGRGPVEDLKKAVAAGLNVEIVEVVEHGKDLDNTATLQRLKDKNVQYVISHTVQSPVATLLNDAQRLGVTAKSFGEPGKLTFLGAHYTGGNDLIDLAGSAAEDFHWTTSYKLTSEPGPWTDQQLALAKRYGRDDKTANSHNYTNGVMVTQITVETMKRAKEKGKKIDRAALYEELLAMNGNNAYTPYTTVGPVTYSKTDKEGVDTLQLYAVKDGVFRAVGKPYAPEYYKKLK